MSGTETKNLYALLNLSSDATAEEIKRAYKKLGLHFHTDKLPPTQRDRSDDVQETFLALQLAHDILLDPVLRLAYDHYGMECVILLRKMEQRAAEQRTRRTVGLAEEEDSDDEDDTEEETLYETLERFLRTNPPQAREELHQFMHQYGYYNGLSSQNSVHLSFNMEFPPVADLEKLYFHGRDYLKMVNGNARTVAQTISSQQEREYIVQQVKSEQGMVDFQLKRIRDMQKAEMGITLTCIPPSNSSTTTKADGTLVHQPNKWKMTMGGTTNVVYDDVAKIAKLSKSKKKHQEKHPASTFCTVLYQPVPDSQIYATANLSKDQSHQLVIGSSRTFSNRSAFRYFLTILSKSPLDSPIMMNFKTDRHIAGIGLTSGGLTIGGSGSVLQWHAGWQAASGSENQQRTSAKVQVGLLQGNSITLGYNYRFKKTSWLKEYISIPKKFELSTVISSYPKVESMVFHDLPSLAHCPTLGFGFEHDITLGCWTWIWEWTYLNSSFRIPIPLLQVGTVVDPTTFYIQRMYMGICGFLYQSMVADILHDDENDKVHKKTPNETTESVEMAVITKDGSKTQVDAQRELLLMEYIAEKKHEIEEAKRGLVILQATYWLEAKDVNGILQLLSMDARKQLQFWVVDGKLRMSSVPKSFWMGFYDLQANIQVPKKSSRWDWRLWRRWTQSRNLKDISDDSRRGPQLTIRFKYDEHTYEATFGETESISLPNSEKAQLLGLSDNVQ